MADNKIEQYLIDLTLSYRKDEGHDVWLVDDEEHEIRDVAIAFVSSLVIVRTVVMKAPAENRLELFTKLLELNATDVVHGAYALEGDQIVLIDTLEYETMDCSEFRATLDAFSLALAQHYPVLSKYRQ
ncbi:hypothetical protein FACS1894172_11280 [Spirochaetia bacterium]|nr:hypothetical protein FACS1894164_14570 [Spirochaetia bacterium]GHU33210.1 hypothetical protein FACS1894172_11280 [Spirochaetia bacterium]